MQTSYRLSRWRREMFHYKWNALNTARLQIEQNLRAYRAQRAGQKIQSMQIVSGSFPFNFNPSISGGLYIIEVKNGSMNKKFRVVIVK